MRKMSALLAFLFIILAASLALAHGHGHVMGTVAAVTADRIEVKAKDGKVVTVPLTKETKYFKGQQPATHADVKVGERVVVHLGEGGVAVEVRLPSA